MRNLRPSRRILSDLARYRRAEPITLSRRVSRERRSRALRVYRRLLIRRGLRAVSNVTRARVRMPVRLRGPGPNYSVIQVRAYTPRLDAYVIPR